VTRHRALACLNDDLDTNDDGVLDVTSWTAITRVSPAHELVPFLAFVMLARRGAAARTGRARNSGEGGRRAAARLSSRRPGSSQA